MTIDLIVQTGPPPLAFISPSVLFTGSGDKRISLCVFLLSLGQYSLNVKKKERVEVCQAMISLQRHRSCSSLSSVMLSALLRPASFLEYLQGYD